MSQKIMSKNIIKLIVILVVAIAVIVGSVYLITRPSKIAYQYEQVKTGKITETVNVVGSIKAADNIDLSFERSGKINTKNVAVGDKVTAGQVLLTLDNSDASAQLSQAQAALNKQLAGNRPEYIAQLQAAVDQAAANFNQVSAASDSSLHIAESLKLTAENNLKLASGGESSQIVSDTYESSVAVLQAIQNSLTNSLAKADNILGVDNTSANDKFRNNLSVKDPSKLNIAKNDYVETKANQQSFFGSNNYLNSTDHNQVDATISRADLALSSTRDLLKDITVVLDNSIVSVDLSLSELDNLKTTIQSARTDNAAKSTALTDQKHAITNAKNSYTSYQISFDKVTQDLNDVKKKTAADNAAAQAALDKARAVLADAKNPPREVDLAGARVAIQSAKVNYDKATLLAPFDGTVSRQTAELGALATPGVPVISIISANKYQIEIYLSETDLPKIKVGNLATVTLDNLGSNSEFNAQVIKIDPAATQLANGTSAYKVTLQFANEDERLKVGLTANVKIVGAEKDNALIIPSHDVVQKNGEYFVMVLNSKQVLEQKPVEIGLKGENNEWEIISGLQAGDSVVNFSSVNN